MDYGMTAAGDERSERRRGDRAFGWADAPAYGDDFCFRLERLMVDFQDHPEQIGYYLADLEELGQFQPRDKERAYAYVAAMAGLDFANRAFGLRRAVQLDFLSERSAAPARAAGAAGEGGADDDSADDDSPAGPEPVLPLFRESDDELDR